MKIAKKVLAVAMAVAMIACFAAMAFAAPEGAKVAITPSAVEDGKFTVILSVQNCLGLTAGDVVLEYDAAALEFVPFNAKVDSLQCKTLPDAIAFTNAGNTFNGMGNAKEEAGKVKFAFNFLESLDIETFGVEGVDAADVKLFQMTFKVIGDVATTDLKLTGAAKFAEGEDLTVDEKVTVTLKKVEETTEAPTTEAPTTEAPSTPAETTKPGVVEGPNTGDTGVLAIAAGVVALAGAAFVVSKKRK